MKRILFLALWIIPVTGALAQEGIEIYANGHHYDSFDAYQLSKGISAAPTVARTPIIGLDKIYVLGVENGMANALQGFYENSGQSYLFAPRNISSSQLEGAIQEAAERSDNPKLLISMPGKLRIMALTARESDQ